MTDDESESERRRRAVQDVFDDALEAAGVVGLPTRGPVDFQGTFIVNISALSDEEAGGALAADFVRWWSDTATHTKFVMVHPPDIIDVYTESSTIPCAWTVRCMLRVAPRAVDAESP